MFSFNKVDFQVIATKILGSNRIDTLIYAPMSVNELEVGKTQSVDSLKAISNNCLNIVIKSTTSGVYSDMCDIGSFKKLSATFGDIIDVRSNLCSGFIPSNDVFNGSVSNAPGWIVNSSPLTFGFPAKTLTTTCRVTPYNLSSNGFYPGITSTYLWSNGATTSSISVNTPGIYSLTVNYKTGCSITDAVTINLNNNLAGTFSVTPVICNGQSNAMVSFSLTADTAYNHTYQYNWTTPSSTVNSIYTSFNNNSYNSLTAGIYTLTIIDTTSNSTLCRYTRTVSVNQPLVLTTAISSNSILCFGLTTGSLTSLNSGGNAGYTYNWFNGTSTYTTQNLTNQGAGMYTLTVTDSKNCIVNSTVTISQPTSPITSSVSSLANVNCFGQSTGAATVSTSGGTGASTYTWVPSGGNNAIATGLGPNNYTVNVLDVNNCPTSTTLSITQPTSALTIVASSQTNVSCNSYSNAVASVTVTGGTSGYFYTWNTGTSVTQTLNNISVGNYTANVTDANGCIITQSFVITEPAILQSTILSSTQANCGSSNGSATYSVSGGTPSYIYSWTTPSTSYTTSALSTNSLSAGTNQLMVIDMNGCVTNTSVVITNPNSPTITVTTNSIICYGNNTGSINTTIIGGTPTYSYNWSNGSNASNLSNLAAGNYTLIVIDVNNCLATQSASIAQPTSAISLAVTNIIGVNCFGQNMGSANATVNGGTASYTYTWLPVNTNTPNLINVAAGSYTISVMDANGCSTGSVIAINNASSNSLIATIASSTQATCGQDNGEVSVSVVGGSPNYNYLWLPNNSTSANIAGLAVGSYTLIVSDNYNCMDTVTFILDCKTALFIPEIFTPNGDDKNDFFVIKGIESYPNNVISIFNRWGSLVYSKDKYNNTWNGTSSIGNTIGKDLLPSATYFVVFDFGDDTSKPYHGFVELKY